MGAVLYPGGGGLTAADFLPEAYGATGNGLVTGDIVTVNTSNVVSSASAPFTAAMIGRWMMINGGLGTANIPLIGQIQGVGGNGTQAQLSQAAQQSASGCPGVWGTDDTAALDAAFQAAGAYGLSSGQFYANVRLSNKIYVAASGPTQQKSGASALYNTQVRIPYPNLTGAGPKLTIRLTGTGANGFCQFWESLVPNYAGSCIVSMLTNAPSTTDPTYLTQSVIGGPSGGGAFTGGIANTKFIVTDVEVISPVYTNQYAWDFGFLSAARAERATAHIWAPTGVGGGTSPLLKDLPSQPAFQGKIGAGFRFPVGGNNDDTTAEDCAVEGYSRGYYLFDHFVAPRLASIYNDVALVIDPTLGPGGDHAITIGCLSCEVHNGALLVAGGAGAGAGGYVVDIRLDAECASTTYEVSDAGNALRGIVRWSDPADPRAPTVVGGAHLTFINDLLGPGQWTGAMTPAVPAVPATGVAQLNTSYRPASVIITSGGAAVTAIAVNGVATGLTLGASGAVTVPVGSGATITLTYGGAAPTWTWWLQ
jgi:hypothetical protein